MLEEGDFSRQAQYLVMFQCHVSWQAQYLAKFWEVAGAGNAVFFHTKCVSTVRSLISANRGFAACRLHGRFMVESSGGSMRQHLRDFSIKS